MRQSNRHKVSIYRESLPALSSIFAASKLWSSLAFLKLQIQQLYYRSGVASMFVMESSHTSSTSPSPKSLLTRRKRMQIRRFRAMVPPTCAALFAPSRNCSWSTGTCIITDQEGSTVVDVERVSSALVRVTRKDPNSLTKAQLAAVVTAISESDTPTKSSCSVEMDRLSADTTDQAFVVYPVSGNECYVEETAGAADSQAGNPCLEKRRCSKSFLEQLSGKIPDGCPETPSALSEQQEKSEEQRQSISNTRWLAKDAAAGSPPVVSEERLRTTFAGDGSCPHYSLISVIGRRHEMEDAVAAVPHLGTLMGHPEDASSSESRDQDFLHFYGVYDGHGGSQAAFYCKERLHSILLEELAVDNKCGRLKTVEGSVSTEEASVHWQKVMSSCFQRVDAEVAGICPKGVQCEKADGNLRCCPEPAAPEAAGTTAVVAVIGPKQIIVANCGDSRAVMSRGGKAIALSQDHKPDRPDEMERIESAGGRVISWNGYRVMGVLSMTRAIGDRFLKPYIIPDPEVTCIDRSENDECLILASDGLWDKVSTEDACNITRRCLAGKRFGKHVYHEEGREESPADVAVAILTKLALARGSSDNISVVVVDLKRR